MPYTFWLRLRRWNTLFPFNWYTGKPGNNRRTRWFLFHDKIRVLELHPNSDAAEAYPTCQTYACSQPQPLVPLLHEMALPSIDRMKKKIPIKMTKNWDRSLSPRITTIHNTLPFFQSTPASENKLPIRRTITTHCWKFKRILRRKLFAGSRGKFQDNQS